MNLPVIHTLYVDADLLTYRNAWAAQQNHYDLYFKGKFLEKTFRYSKDYKAFLKEQPEHLQKHYEGRAREVRLDLKIATDSVDKCIMHMKKKLNAGNVVCFLTDEEKSNFRYDMATLLPYKAHRSSRPIYYPQVREHIINRWKAEVIVGEEADDALCQAQYPHWWRLMNGSVQTDSDVTCIATLDKDLQMVPGYNYNFEKDKLIWISELDGLRFFYTQLLTGDKQVDNIPGLYQITGKMATAKIKEPLQYCETEEEMYTYVRSVWEKHLPKEIPVLDADGDVTMIDSNLDDVLIEIGNLLWMRREKGTLWTFPI